MILCPDLKCYQVNLSIIPIIYVACLQLGQNPCYSIKTMRAPISQCAFRHYQCPDKCVEKRKQIMQWKYSLVKLWHSCAFVPHMWSHLSPFSIRIYLPFFLCLTSTWSGGFETRFWPGRLSFSEFWPKMLVQRWPGIFVCGSASPAHRSALGRKTYGVSFSSVVCGSGTGDQYAEPRWKASGLL